MIECEILDAPQRSVNWYKARKGVLTASRAFELTTDARIKSLAYQLLSESMSEEIPEDGFVSEAMQRGIDLEDDARAWYEYAANKDVKTVGLCLNKLDIGKKTITVGASPDGLVQDEGGHVHLVEVKCPSSKKHIEYMTGALPKPYVYQMQFQMMVTGVTRCDFVSFDDRFHEKHRGVIHVVRRSQSDMDYLKERIGALYDKMDEIQNKIINVR